MKVMNLATYGVVRNVTPKHHRDGELQVAQNVQRGQAASQGALRRRDGIGTLADVGGPVLSVVNIGYVPIITDRDRGDPMQARVSKSASQTLTTATLTVASFNVENYDIGPLHDTVTNNSRMTVPPNGAGYYLIIAQASFAARPAAAGRVGVYIYKNGAQRISIQEEICDDGGDAGLGLSIQCSAIIPLGVGDYVELWARQDSGGNLDLLGGSDDLTSLTVFRLATL
jgi:hypothetical protein